MVVVVEVASTSLVFAVVVWLNDWLFRTAYDDDDAVDLRAKFKRGFGNMTKRSI